MKNKKEEGPKILILDIETSPLITYTWGLFDQNINLNQLKEDWHLLAVSAKWLGRKDIFYQDQRNVKDISNDFKLTQKMWELLDECDIVITFNGAHFDIKKLNSRFIIHGMRPPSSFKHIDVLKIARKKFGFTSNKLEFLTNKLCKNNKKYNHKNFSGFELWKACLSGNKKAWKEMEKYNKLDVTSLEELYDKIKPWDDTVNLNIFKDDDNPICSCGSTKFDKKGFAYASTSKYQRYICVKCGKNVRGRVNLLSKQKRKSLLVGIKHE